MRACVFGTLNGPFGTLGGDIGTLGGGGWG